MNDVHRQVGDLTAFTPGNETAVAQKDAEIERLRKALSGRLQNVERLRAALREVYEVWAGSDGMIPETAPEAYQERLILQMRDAAARGLGITTPPQSEPTNG